MKSLLIALCFLQLPSVLSAQMPANQPVQRKISHYYSVVNHFDSVSVRYDYGEVFIGSDDTWQPVELRYSKDNLHLDSRGKGADTMLSRHLVTEPFEYSGQAFIYFHRGVFIISKYFNEESWFAHVGNIVNEQSFTLEIVELMTKRIVAVIDSVYVGANPLTEDVPHYGELIDSFSIRKQLTNLVHGTVYFVRLVPYRNGSKEIAVHASLYTFEEAVGPFVIRAPTEKYSGLIVVTPGSVRGDKLKVTFDLVPSNTIVTLRVYDKMGERLASMQTTLLQGSRTVEMRLGVMAEQSHYLVVVDESQAIIHDSVVSHH